MTPVGADATVSSSGMTAITGTPGITVDAAGHRIIDKEHRGLRIYVRLGPASEEVAQRRSTAEMQRIELELQQKANARPRFADAAARYLEESRDKRTVDVTKWHVCLLTPYIGKGPAGLETTSLEARN